MSEERRIECPGCGCFYVPVLEERGRCPGCGRIPGVPETDADFPGNEPRHIRDFNEMLKNSFVFRKGEEN